jgi:two-component system LytT family sensor kinase
MWNVGGLLKSLLFLLGTAKHAPATLIAGAIQFSGAAIWPIPTLSIWRSLAQRRWQRTASKTLQILAPISGVAIIAALWSIALFSFATFPVETVGKLTAYNASILLVLAAFILFRQPFASPTVWVFAGATLLGVFGATSAIILAHFVHTRSLNAGLMVMSEQSVLLIDIGVFFLFARFRFADLFIRYSLRIVLATGLSVALVFLTHAPFVSRLASLTAFPRTAEIFASSVLAAALLLAFSLLDRSVVDRVNEWILRAPDYRASTNLLIERLRGLSVECEIGAVAEEIAQKTLELCGVHVLSCNDLPQQQWPQEIGESEVVELSSADPLRHRLPQPNIDFLFPVRVRSHVTHVLAISLGATRRGLVTHEVNYLRTVAVQLGNRLDLLRTEREMLERRTRENLLRQQLTDAELRALRSQINPHFLFNSLNTIADLIVTNPERAEIMTLRLAKVFRHVLAQSSQPLTSVQDEIEFVRTYLYIEEARFSDRLRVQIDVTPEVATEPIPSLILQPIIENALKHGLAPKPGPCHLWISARAQGNHICLRVEDDGIGPRWGTLGRSNGSCVVTATASLSPQGFGVGLTNVAQRLKTLYWDDASLSFEPRETGGSCVTMLLPKGAGTAA